MTKEIFEKLLSEKQYKAVKSILGTMNPVDIAAVLPEFEERELVLLFRLIPKENAAMVFTYLETDEEQILVEAFTERELRDILGELFIDDTVDIIEEMPANLVERILKCTDADRREKINEVLNYPGDSAGSIMTLEYVNLGANMTVGEALKRIKSTGIHKETIYTCYVTDRHKLIGTVSAKDLLTCDDDELISDIMEEKPLSVTTHTDKEDVAKLFNKYDVLSIPVVDNESCMVGIVTFDDAIDVMEDEVTEDIAKMNAIMPGDNTYFGTSVGKHVKRRIVWLLVLMLSATVTGSIIAKYEDLLSVLPLVVSFIPMLMDTSGNCGSQASVLIIRGIALDEIQFSDIFRVMWKEIRVSVLVSLILASVNFVRVYIMYHSNPLVLKYALFVSLTLFCTVIISKMIGCTLPLLAKKIHLDPALMASPIITTLVDACTIAIYFAVISAAFAQQLAA